MAYKKELEVAMEAVRKASALAHHVAQGKIASLVKDDKSPVTIADFGAQAVINSALHEAFPEDPIVGEECSDDVKARSDLADRLLKLTSTFASSDPRFQAQSEEQRISNLCEAIDYGKYEGGAKGREWALDPVDGTKGFLRGGQYAVCLASIVDSIVQVGVIGCPNSGDKGGLFYAVRGQGGSWVPSFPEHNEQTTPQPLKFREVENIEDAQFCESVEAGHSAKGKQERIARTLGLSKPSIQMDSQAKYCVLAKGDADIYLRLPVSLSYEEKIWDHAAGSLLITEAGGIVTDMHGNELDFGQGRTLAKNKGIVASSKLSHPKISHIIAEPDQN